MFGRLVEIRGMKTMKKSIAEFIGTFTLVLVGCGAAVLAGEQIGLLGISLAFGLALIAMAYGIGPISGCHINPAVSLGAFVADRISMSDLIQYVIAQCLGAIAGAGILYLIASGKLSGFDIATSGLGQNGWGAGYLGEYGTVSAFVYETIATFLFVVVILGATQANAPVRLAGLAIGLALTALHFGIQITGTSLNPARSLGPALFVGGQAISQLWLFILAPCLGAAAAGLLFKMGLLEAD